MPHTRMDDDLTPRIYIAAKQRFEMKSDVIIIVITNKKKCMLIAYLE